jgi:hypothetical protein
MTHMYICKKNKRARKHSRPRCAQCRRYCHHSQRKRSRQYTHMPSNMSIPSPSSPRSTRVMWRRSRARKTTSNAHEHKRTHTRILARPTRILSSASTQEYLSSSLERAVNSHFTERRKARCVCTCVCVCVVCVCVSSVCVVVCGVFVHVSSRRHCTFLSQMHD